MCLSVIHRWTKETECEHVCFEWCQYRDISFLCDAMVTQRKTTPLPPLTDRNSIGDTQVSLILPLFTFYLKIKSRNLQHNKMNQKTNKQDHHSTTVRFSLLSSLPQTQWGKVGRHKGKLNRFKLLCLSELEYLRQSDTRGISHCEKQGAARPRVLRGVSLLPCIHPLC